MTKRARVILLVPLLVVALLLVTFLFALSMAYVTKRQAEGLLAAVQQIRVGVSDYKFVSQITAPYGSYRTNFSGEVSDPQIQFMFVNWWLSRLKLAPYTDFIVTIVFKDDVVIAKSARVLLANTGGGASVMDMQRGLRFCPVSDEPKGSNHLVSGLAPNSPTSVWRISICDVDSYDDEGRRRDWGFDLSCLTRLGGCRDARTVLPAVASTAP